MPWQQCHFARFPSSVKFQCCGWHCFKKTVRPMVCVLGCREQSSTAALYSLLYWIPEARIPPESQSSPRLEFEGLGWGPQCWNLEKQLETRFFFRCVCLRGNFLPQGAALVSTKSSSQRCQCGNAGWEQGGITSSLFFLLPNSSSCWYSKLPSKLSELPCYSNESTFLLWLASVYGMGSVFHN